MSKAILKDIIELQKQDVKVVECNNCQKLMVNIDADEVKPGDLVTLKRKSVRISNPNTKEDICLKCEIEQAPSFRERLVDWFEDLDVGGFDDDDDDSGFFSTPSLGGSFTPSTSSPSFGGFGGFGGGVSFGGGASRGF